MFLPHLVHNAAAPEKSGGRIVDWWSILPILALFVRLSVLLFLSTSDRKNLTSSWSFFSRIFKEILRVDCPSFSAKITVDIEIDTKSSRSAKNARRATGDFSTSDSYTVIFWRIFMPLPVAKVDAVSSLKRICKKIALHNRAGKGAISSVRRLDFRLFLYFFWNIVEFIRHWQKTTPKNCPMHILIQRVGYFTYLLSYVLKSETGDYSLLPTLCIKIF